MVVDAGDLIQGEPFATFFSAVQPTEPNPVVDALNAMLGRLRAEVESSSCLA